MLEMFERVAMFTSAYFKRGVSPGVYGEGRDALRLFVIASQNILQLHQRSLRCHAT